MVLHTLNSGPSSAAFADCLRMLAPGDALVLLGDGAYCAVAGTPALEQLAASDAAVYVLTEHASARGCRVSGEAVSAIDMSRFVELSEQFPRQLAWY